MSRPDPIVQSGMRSSAEARKFTPSIAGNDFTSSADAVKSRVSKIIAAGIVRAQIKQPDEVIFGSIYHNYRLQVTAPADKIDPNTGQRFPARPKAAKFNQGVCVTSDLDIIHKIKGCPVDCDVHAKGFRNRPHPRYGLDVFDLMERHEKHTSERIDELTATVLAQGPEAVERLLSSLAAAQEFEMPQRKKKDSE